MTLQCELQCGLAVCALYHDRLYFLQSKNVMFVNIPRQSNTVADYVAKQGMFGFGAEQWTHHATGTLFRLLYFDLIGATSPTT